jgi:hypothetical protein
MLPGAVIHAWRPGNWMIAVVSGVQIAGSLGDSGGVTPEGGFLPFCIISSARFAQSVAGGGSMLVCS